MTDKEAATKWCPMVQRTTAPSGAYISNRDDADFNCLGPDCACWILDMKPNPYDPETWTGHCGLIHR